MACQSGNTELVRVSFSKPIINNLLFPNDKCDIELYVPRLMNDICVHDVIDAL